MRTIAFLLFVLAACVARQTVAQEVALQKLTASLQALRATSPSTAADRDRISSEVLALAEPFHRPSLSTIVVFTSRLTRAVSVRQLSDSQASRLATQIDTVLHSAGIGHWKFKEAISDLQAVLTSAGVDTKTAKLIAIDLEAVGNEVRGPEGTPVKPLR